MGGISCAGSSVFPRASVSELVGIIVVSQVARGRRRLQVGRPSYISEPVAQFLRGGFLCDVREST